MKIRYGHVSNSSTSSFVVAVNTTVPDFGGIAFQPSFYIFWMTSIDELTQWFQRQYGDTWKIYHHADYEVYKKYIEQGNCIYYFSVDTSEPTLPQVVKSLKDQGFEILKREDY